MILPIRNRRDFFRRFSFSARQHRPEAFSFFSKTCLEFLPSARRRSTTFAQSLSSFLIQQDTKICQFFPFGARHKPVESVCDAFHQDTETVDTCQISFFPFSARQDTTAKTLFAVSEQDTQTRRTVFRFFSKTQTFRTVFSFFSKTQTFRTIFRLVSARHKTVQAFFAIFRQCATAETFSAFLGFLCKTAPPGSLFFFSKTTCRGFHPFKTSLSSFCSSLDPFSKTFINSSDALSFFGGHSSFFILQDGLCHHRGFANIFKYLFGNLHGHTPVREKPHAFLNTTMKEVLPYFSSSGN